MIDAFFMISCDKVSRITKAANGLKICIYYERCGTRQM